jgi:uncharacterized protein (UPF0548 family)
LDEQRGAPLSYGPAGLTRSPASQRYQADMNAVELGRGREVFERARRALTEWRMFRLGWVRVLPERPVIQEGETVCVAAGTLGLWFLNACRVVYLVDEADRFGFAYGTLQAHAEEGEELFLVEHDRADDSVSYRIAALSRPRAWHARLGYPFTRALQRRFARDSMKAMAEAVR